MKYDKIYFIFLILGLLFIGFFSLSNYLNIKNGTWICIAEQCSDWATGDEWITDNCRPSNNTLICDIVIDEKKYRAPLDMINISNVKSCRNFECVTQIYVKEMEDKK